ncbi:molybdenum ABC transporter ATP-binding protein [Thiohalorhabdus denitrificans]|uniref:Molybdate transport system ATP-binding protein n=1 Tax=Thiohalorhabdus denitrificans TaxID=381306 RepID=A0A0P9C938_9GAMM|nr:molybdenum ABC transporter ATP-binding protein [Thiohalorhabdus denitrificans]KPV39671.1 molybdenum ABC transporter ATP-binding protein [Thiohalorhabdus denitrificans]SCX94648.1 molybdate transport system ATP-binding protein [Thiohalorhabdus denitrificans]
MTEAALKARFALDRPDFHLEAAFEAPPGGVTALFGPSGSGKTTLLRCVAGLERAPEGYLEVGGTVWQDEDAGLFRPPHRRGVGYVFQEAALLPHRTVTGNLAYGYRRARGPRRLAWGEVIDLLGLEPLLERRPAGLSGGERQRVAIGRALLAGPNLLLLDEPLSALDRAAKAEILPYLERLRDRLALPVLLVSHAVDEVARLADHLVLLEAGHVQGTGPLAEMATRLDLPLAHGEPAEAVVEARVAGHEPGYGLTSLSFPGGRLSVPALDRPPDAPVRVRIRARDVSLTRQPPRETSILNVLTARVADMREEGAEGVMVRLEAGGAPLLARITRKSRDALGLEPGMEVFAQIKGIALAD